jgi:hypothetical protein
MIKLQFLNNSDARAAAWLRARYSRIAAEVEQGMQRALVSLAGHSGATALRGRVLRIQAGTPHPPATGRAQTYSAGATVAARARAATTAWCGTVHEHRDKLSGARRLQRPPHLIRRAMGERVMTGSPYGIHIRARYSLRTSLIDRRAAILAEVSAALQRGLAT